MAHSNIVVALVALGGQILAKPFAPSSVPVTHRRLASTGTISAAASRQSYWPPIQGDSVSTSSAEINTAPFSASNPTSSSNELNTGRQSYWPPSPGTFSSTSARTATLPVAATAAVEPEVKSLASQFEIDESVQVCAPKSYSPKGKSYTPWDNWPSYTHQPSALHTGAAPSRVASAVEKSSTPPVAPSTSASPGKSYTPWGSSATKVPRTSVKLYATSRSYTPWDSGPTPARTPPATPLAPPPAPTAPAVPSAAPRAPDPPSVSPVTSTAASSGSKSYWPPSPGTPSSRTAAVPPTPPTPTMATPPPMASGPPPQTATSFSPGYAPNKSKSYAPWDNARPSARAPESHYAPPSPEPLPAAENAPLPPSLATAPPTQTFTSPSGSKSYWPPLGAKK